MTSNLELADCPGFRRSLHEVKWCCDAFVVVYVHVIAEPNRRSPSIVCLSTLLESTSATASTRVTFQSAGNVSVQGAQCFRIIGQGHRSYLSSIFSATFISACMTISRPFPAALRGRQRKAVLPSAVFPSTRWAVSTATDTPPRRWGCACWSVRIRPPHRPSRRRG